ncbi:uncharacterized protein DFL_000371 [Arthrobotrys flagrans]|uniref:Aminoglycoside phosphotransferase domain-containing protein n=1 Tax=Arthrobotrys flagrans TaxID=97331 RepID=A0A437AE48_ARTFL|nr:hypothetical protein DFL_000371 [Arthrobotrys flagrans]
MDPHPVHLTEPDLKSAEVLFKLKNGATKVVRIGDKAIKYGIGVSQREADTMAFVRNHTSIPVPRVYDFYCDEKGHGYIVMDYVEGQNLENRWKHLDGPSKAKIAEQLRRYMEEMRSIPPPSPIYIGGVNHTQADDMRNGHALGGPFASETDFNHWLISRLLPHIRGRTLVMPYLEEQLAAQTAQKRHAIVFTHADFHPRNIMVKGDKVVGWLDWEVAGWFPSHWEFIKAMQPLAKTDWLDYLVVILEEYEDEYILDSVLGMYLQRF